MGKWESQIANLKGGYLLDSEATDRRLDLKGLHLSLACRLSNLMMTIPLAEVSAETGKEAHVDWG